jgi:hypothetical protein
LENIRSTVSLNLSNQANTNKAKKSNLLQLNCFVILGLDYLENAAVPEENIPLSININDSGELTISGLSEEILNSENVKIYSDRKVTSSED